MTSYFTYDSNLRDRNKYTSTVQTTFGTRRYFSSLDTEVYFGQTQIDEIVDLLINNTKLSYKDIANQYMVSQDTILNIS